MTTAYRFLRRILKEYPFQLSAVILLLTLVGLSESVGISMLVPLLNLLFAQAGDAQPGSLDKISETFANVAGAFGISLTLGNVLVSLFLLFVAQSGLRFGAALLVAKLHVRFRGDLMRKLYHTYFEASWPFFYTNKLGDLTNPITVEASRAAGALQYLAKMLSDMLLALSYTLVAMLVSWELTIGALIIGLLASLLSRGLMHRAEEYGAATAVANNDLQSEIIDKLSSAKMVKASATEEYANESLSRVVQTVLGYRFKSLLNASLLSALYHPVTIGVVCLGIYLSFTYLSLEFSLIVLFLAVFYRLMPRLSSIQSIYQQFLTQAPSLVEVDRRVANAVSFREDNGVHIFDSLRESVRLENVNFCYVEDEHVVTLRNINLTIKQGEITAIVGGSGGGKSTLVDLCLGLLTPDSGRILVDNRDIRDFDRKSWRRKIGYVSQDVFLLNDTVRNNIAWVCPDATSEEIEEAARRAYAHEFVLQLTEGYQTLVGDKGVRLSGGQRQRICLARALLQNPDILILDEATSALDAESEQKIQRAVQALHGKITVLMISHRLATVRGAHSVYVLEHGEIAESGTWDELVAEGSRFEQLRKLQAVG